MSFQALEESRYSGAPVKLFLVRGAADGDEQIGPFGLTDGEQPITVAGIVDKQGQPIVFIPWPIKSGPISHDGTLDKSDVTVSLALGTPIDALFLAYPPSQVVNLTIFEGHVGDDPTDANFKATWLGRITGAGYQGNEMELSCLPVSSSLQRIGLRQNYQLACPHALFGAQCRASKAAATALRKVSSVTRNTIKLNTNLGATPHLFIGGLLEWQNSSSGMKEVRTISAVGTLGDSVSIRGIARGLALGTPLSIIRGCNHQMSGCNQHGNILNFGGQPFIPTENPLSQKNQFY